MRPRLTERQNQALEFVRGYLRLHQRPPSYMEIGRELGIRSTNGVSKLLDALQRKGYIGREPGSARSITLLDENDDLFAAAASGPSLPVASRTSSAEPELLRSSPRGAVSVDPLLLRPADPDRCLVVQAGDDGMNGAGIRKGDLLVVRETDRTLLPDRALVAVIVQDEFLARHYTWLNHRIHLHPADRTYSEEVFTEDDPACFVIGPVIALMRKLG